MLKIAVLYEDNSIFVSYTPDEFRQELEMWIKSGKTVKEAMDLIIDKLKKAILTK